MADYTIFDKFPPTLKFNSEAPFKDDKLNDVFKESKTFEKVGRLGLDLQQRLIGVASKDKKRVNTYYTAIQRKDNYKDDLVDATDENKTYRFEFGFHITLDEIFKHCLIEEGIFDTLNGYDLIDGTATNLSWNTDMPLKGQLVGLQYLNSQIINPLYMNLQLFYQYDHNLDTITGMANPDDNTSPTPVCIFNLDGFKTATFIDKAADLTDLTDLTTHRCGITTVGQAKNSIFDFYGLCKSYYNDKLIFTGNFENGEPKSGTFTNPDTNIETTSVLGCFEYMSFVLKLGGILPPFVDFIVSDKVEEDTDESFGKCCLCSGFLDCRYGNNPAPLKYSGKCCNKCNAEKVIPARYGFAPDMNKIDGDVEVDIQKMTKEIDKAVAKEKKNGYGGICYKIPQKILNNDQSIPILVDYIQSKYDKECKYTKTNINGFDISDTICFNFDKPLASDMNNSRKKRKIDADVDVYVDIEKLSKEIDEQRELKAEKYPEKEKITDIYDMTEDEAINHYKSKRLDKKKYDEKMKDWRLEMISREKHHLLSKSTLSSPPAKRKRK